MAETRKHRVTVRDDVDAALLAAFGETPVAQEPEQPHSTATAASLLLPGGTLAGFTFGSSTPAAPAEQE